MKAIRKRVKIKNGKINWVCLRDKCPRSCCGSFKDRNRIYNKLYKSCFNIGHEEILLTLEDKKIIEKINGQKFIKILKNGSAYIKLNKNGFCPHLKNGLCSIYSIRPQICRAYPFYLDLSSGLNVDILCPGIGQEWTEIKTIRKYINAMFKVCQFQLKLNQKFLRK